MSWRSFPISCWVLTPCWISLNTRSKSRSSRRTPRTSIGLCKVFSPRSQKAPCSASSRVRRMSESQPWGTLPPYKKAPLPPLPSMLAALGPGVIFMALAQGSGELIWWPYIIAKYGLSFLFLLLPACLLQFPITYEIGRYTLLTGESIFQGFIRLNRTFALLLWVLLALSFLWFGAFAAAGGGSFCGLTDFFPGRGGPRA